MNKINYHKALKEELAKAETKDKTLMLHACCAPCSSHVLTFMVGQIRIKVLYYNPNIVDRTEHDKRAAELSRLVEEILKENPGAYIETEPVVFEPEEFLTVAKGLELEPEGGLRCEKCFELRLRYAARRAKETGADYFATTLTISPLKNAELLNSIGERIASEEGIKYLPSDFKKENGYKHSVELSQKYGLYRQNFCGCPFSEAEAMRREGNSVPDKR